MGILHQARIGEARKPLRDRRPLADCDLRTLVRLQHEWGMSDAQLFGLRLGADAVCLRSDVSVASAIANLKHMLVSAAATLSMVEDNCVEDDPARHVVRTVRDQLREGLGMLGVVGRAVDDEVGHDDDAQPVSPKAPAPRASDGAVVSA